MAIGVRMPGSGARKNGIGGRFVAALLTTRGDLRGHDDDRYGRVLKEVVGRVAGQDLSLGAVGHEVVAAAGGSEREPRWTCRKDVGAGPASTTARRAGRVCSATHTGQEGHVQTPTHVPGKPTRHPPAERSADETCAGRVAPQHLT